MIKLLGYVLNNLIIQQYKKDISYILSIGTEGSLSFES